jgi:alginate O-acetyltransferase complex protein AlgI
LPYQIAKFGKSELSFELKNLNLRLNSTHFIKSMLFTSLEFLFCYLPVTFLGFFIIANMWGQLASAWWLASASIFFYGWWDIRYVPLLLGSVVFNYLIGRTIAQFPKKSILLIGIAGDLALLGLFKYSDFFIATLNGVIDTQVELLHLVLPLGISFFTFTQIAFLVDSFRGCVREKNFGHYILFVTYFPHLIAGPVLHHNQMMPQFSKESVYRINFQNIALGTSIFVVGLAKKLLIADSMSIYVAPVFNSAHSGIGIDPYVAWAGVLAYTFQIYFDFSGYSDMAFGLSRLFGIDLPINFLSPYKSKNIIEFWRSWHITLSLFLKDYLYIPLGGNRHGNFRRYFNLLATMLLGGFWHGANWTFVIWGGLHGIFLCLNHAWSNFSTRFYTSHSDGIFSNMIRISITFIAVVFAWVFFRAENLSTARIVLKAMLCHGGNAGWYDVMPSFSFTLFLVKLIVCSILVWVFPNVYQIIAYTEKSDKRIFGVPLINYIKQEALSLGILLSLLFLATVASQFGPGDTSPFLYFQF